MTETVLGIDIGGTNTKYSLVSQSGHVHEVIKFPTEAHLPLENFLERLKKSLDTYLNKYSTNLDQIKIGIGCPNYSSVLKKLFNPPNLSWREEGLEELFKKHLGTSVKIENDANAAAIGEHRWGKAKGIDHFVVITVGTGIGSGIFANGSLIRGHRGLSGEAGHLNLAPTGRQCGCGGIAHFESYCSVPAIKKTYFELTGVEATYKDLIELFQKHDPKTIETFEQTSTWFALGLSQIITLFGPQKIILAGGGMVIGEKFLNMISEKVNQHVFPNLRDSFSLEISDLALSEGAILGAAALNL